PKGLAGHSYWWLIAPFHVFVFPGMIKNIKKVVEENK
ncbi:MAG: DUF2867 domain-containing protein, partial [Actinomycetes bacterium]